MLLRLLIKQEYRYLIDSCALLVLLLVLHKQMGLTDPISLFPIFLISSSPELDIFSNEAHLELITLTHDRKNTLYWLIFSISILQGLAFTFICFLFSNEINRIELAFLYIITFFSLGLIRQFCLLLSSGLLSFYNGVTLQIAIQAPLLFLFASGVTQYRIQDSMAILLGLSILLSIFIYWIIPFLMDTKFITTEWITDDDLYKN